MKNAIVSFEKVNGAKVKMNTKARRQHLPGRIEREEIARCKEIETDVYLHQLAEKNLWYPMD